MNPFVIFWRSVKDLFDELFALIAANLLWVLCSFPLFGFAFFLAINGAPIPAAIAALVGVLPFGPATAGLFAMAQRVTEGRVASWQVFFEGFRQYRTVSWQIYGIWMFGLLAILINLWFYLQLGSILGVFLTVLFVYILAVWWTLLIYLGPLIIIQQEKRLRLIMRNALVMSLGRPLFTLFSGLMMLIIIGLSIWLFILPLLITFALLALWGTRATNALIADAEARRLAREEQQANATVVKLTEKGRGGQIRPRD